VPLGSAAAVVADELGLCVPGVAVGVVPSLHVAKVFQLIVIAGCCSSFVVGLAAQSPGVATYTWTTDDDAGRDDTRHIYARTKQEIAFSMFLIA